MYNSVMQAEHLDELAAAPGVCQSGEGTCEAQPCSGAGAGGSSAVIPAGGQQQSGRRSSSDPGAGDRGSGGRGGSRVAEVEAGSSSSATPRSRASLDEQVAAARRKKEREKDACKLHIVLTYVQVGNSLEASVATGNLSSPKYSSAAQKGAGKERLQAAPDGALF